MKTKSAIADIKAHKDLSDKIKELMLDTRYHNNDTVLINRIQRDEIVKNSKRSFTELNINDFFQMRIEGLISSEFDIVTIRMENFPETKIDNIDEGF